MPSTSRFVSGGTDEAPTERDQAWSKAEREVEQKQREKLQSEQQGSNGPSLYETLQANKAAKQEAFEEAAKLKNQFPTLDDAEIDFLNATAAKQEEEARKVKAQTAADLALFRQQRDEAEKAALREGPVEVAPEGDGMQDMWKVGPKKRKKGKERELIGGVKIRRTSTAEKGKEEEVKSPLKPSEKIETAVPSVEGEEVASKAEPAVTSLEKKSASPTVQPALGLGGYSSDED